MHSCLMFHLSRRSLQAPARCGRNSTLTLARFNSSVAESLQQNLSWPDYLAIRKKKRRWETAMTIPCTLLGLGGGVAYFANQEIDPLKPIMGIDPFIFYGFATMACAGLGSLVGPTIGASLWRLTHRRTMNLIEAREREFHRHIVQNRVDASAQTATSPVPDFYGEKIGSLHEYRQWLRDQAKYKRKAQWPED